MKTVTLENGKKVIADPNAAQRAKRFHNYQDALKMVLEVERQGKRAQIYDPAGKVIYVEVLQ